MQTKCCSKGERFSWNLHKCPVSLIYNLLGYSIRVSFNAALLKHIKLSVMLMLRLKYVSTMMLHVLMPSSGGAFRTKGEIRKVSVNVIIWRRLYVAVSCK